MLDEVGKAQGRYIPTCYLIPANNSPLNIPAEAGKSGLAECLFNALDIPSWIGEGLVDYLTVHLLMANTTGLVHNRRFASLPI